MNEHNENVRRFILFVVVRQCRLAEQAQRQLEKGGKFEDLNQTSRPTELIRSYNSLYSQARIDALDALDTIREMSDAEDLKSKLLFSVVVVGVLVVADDLVLLS
jgi:hypothetical protein